MFIIWKECVSHGRDKVGPVIRSILLEYPTIGELTIFKNNLC